MNSLSNITVNKKKIISVNISNDITLQNDDSIKISDDSNKKYTTFLFKNNINSEDNINFYDSNNNLICSINENGVEVKSIKLFSNSNFVVVSQYGNGNYTTITDAINNTSDGDTIFVQPGIYEEHIDMYNKERHLVGISKESCIVKRHTGLRKDNPCNANVGSIENITFEQYMDQIPEDYYERPSIERSTYAIHIDTRYTSNNRHKLTIRNCRLYCEPHNAIGIGVRFNQTIKIIDCELITTSTDKGGIGIHNDDFYPNSDGAEIIINNCYIQGFNKAVNINSLNNNALCNLSFINNTCFCTETGVTNVINPVPQNNKWGNDISNTILSYGNNISELNYQN